ncbi:MAG: hypothetical protein GY811_10360 [Myxococcales bacterium]|nr:hypothetical protein [Myxococcales bacterium]
MLAIDTASPSCSEIGSVAWLRGVRHSDENELSNVLNRTSLCDNVDDADS